MWVEVFENNNKDHNMSCYTLKKKAKKKRKKSNKIKCFDIGLKHMNLGVKLTSIGPVTHLELFHEAFYRLSTSV